MSRNFKSSGVRIHQSYDVGEVAELLNCTPQTVRAWIKSGLPVLSSQRPLLIMGFELKKFLSARETKSKQKTAGDELYCLKCRAPRKPYGMMLDYISRNENSGRLEGFCGVCETPVRKFTSAKSLAELANIFEISQMPFEETTSP